MVILNHKDSGESLIQITKEPSNSFKVVFYSKKKRIPKSNTFVVDKKILKEIGKWLIKGKENEMFEIEISEKFTLRIESKDTEKTLFLFYKKRNVFELVSTNYRFYNFGKDILEETKSLYNFGDQYKNFMQEYILKGEQRFLLNKLTLEYEADCNRPFTNLIKKSYLRYKSDFARILYKFFAFEGTIEEFVQSSIWKSAERYYEARLFKIDSPLDQQIKLQAYINRFFDKNLPEKLDSSITIYHNHDYEIGRVAVEYGEDIARDVCSELNLSFENFKNARELEKQKANNYYDTEDEFESRHKILFEE